MVSYPSNKKGTKTGFVPKVTWPVSNYWSGVAVLTLHQGTSGAAFRVIPMLGRYVTPANSLVHQDRRGWDRFFGLLISSLSGFNRYELSGKNNTTV